MEARRSASGHPTRVHGTEILATDDADPVRFAQIFSNLLTNAAKYTDPGGVIRVQATREGDNAVIRVQDNGIGISPELMPQLFEAAGFDHHHAKPVDLDALKSLFTRCALEAAVS